MKIGLYFGSFNPVHIGHLIISNHVLNNTLLDQIWFVISPQNPLKKEKFLLNEEYRKHLIDLAIEGERKLRSTNIEFKLPRPSYTIDTMTYLSEKFPENYFSIIMGSDSYNNLKKWKNYKILIERFEIIIYERPGFIVEAVDNTKPSILQAPLLEISSTHIRELIHKKKSIKFLVPDIVKEEIENQQYYK